MENLSLVTLHSVGKRGGQQDEHNKSMRDVLGDRREQGIGEVQREGQTERQWEIEGKREIVTNTLRDRQPETERKEERKIGRDSKKDGWKETQEADRKTESREGSAHAESSGSLSSAFLSLPAPWSSSLSPKALASPPGPHTAAPAEASSAQTTVLPVGHCSSPVHSGYNCPYHWPLLSPFL